MASSSPSRWLRDRCEPAVAMRSPIPASPAKVSGFAPAAIPSRVISARPRVSSPALPLSPKPRPSAAPAAMATTFLSAPHSSTPEDVLVDVEPEATAGDPRGDALGELEVRGRDDRRCRQVACHLGGQVRPRQCRDPADRHVRRLGDDLAHPQQRAALEALDHRQQVGLGGKERHHPRHRGPQVGRRRREDHQVGGVAQGARVGGRDQRRRQVDPGQSRLVAPGLGDPCRRLRGVAQERDRLHPGHDLGQRRPPGPRPDDRDPRTRHLRQLGLRARPAVPRRGPLPDATGALRSFLRRGSLTEDRSRKTSRIGVPSKPNCSRSRFSR